MLLLATRTGCAAWASVKRTQAAGAARAARARAQAPSAPRARARPRAGRHAGGDVSHPPSKMKKIYDQNDAASD